MEKATRYVKSDIDIMYTTYQERESENERERGGWVGGWMGRGRHDVHHLRGLGFIFKLISNIKPCGFIFWGESCRGWVMGLGA